MELCAAGERWEMVAELPRRAAGRVLPPPSISPRPRGVSRRGAAGPGCWGQGGFVTAGLGAGNKAVPEGQLQSVLDRAAPRVQGAVKVPSLQVGGAPLWAGLRNVP